MAICLNISTFFHPDFNVDKLGNKFSPSKYWSHYSSNLRKIDKLNKNTKLYFGEGTQVEVLKKTITLSAGGKTGIYLPLSAAYILSKK